MRVRQWCSMFIVYMDEVRKEVKRGVSFLEDG